MDAEAFWRLLDASRDAESDDARVARLTATLAALPREEILAFQHHFARCVYDAYSFDLMAVSNVVNGARSGEDFDAFIGWLLLQGKSYFEAALADPARAADRATPGVAAKSWALWQAPAVAYKSVTGRDDFDLESQPISLVMEGERLGEEATVARFGELVKRFGWKP
jgi:hypothetical protein